MDAQAGLFALLLLEILAIGILLLVLCDLGKRLLGLDDLLALCAAVVALGALGYVAFWLSFASYPLFGLIKMVLIAAVLVRFADIVRRRLADYGWLAEPLIFTSLFCIAVICLGFSNGGLAEPYLTTRERFGGPLPQDNIIPLVVANMLKWWQGLAPIVGDGQISDRPPLQAGLYLLLNLRNHILTYQVVASLLQATFLLGVWAVAIAAELPKATRRIVMLACCLLPSTIVSTFYTWPKMLTVGFLLVTFALLFCRRPVADKEDRLIGILLGGSAGLAALSHGAAFFPLVGMAAAVVLFWAWPPLRQTIHASATFALLYLPWIAFQQFIDPPGNRLIKWHFAGVIAVDERSALAALRDAYGALSWPDYVEGRLANFRSLVGSWPSSLRDLAEAVLGLDSGLASSLRTSDFFNLLPSLHGYALAVTCALALLPFMSAERRQRAVAMRLFAVIMVTVVFFAVVMFIPNSAINHHGGYFVQVALAIFALSVLSLKAPALALVFVAAQIVSITTLYVLTLRHNPGSWPTMVLGSAAALTLCAYALHPSISGLVRHRPAAARH